MPVTSFRRCIFVYCPAGYRDTLGCALGTGRYNPGEMTNTILALLSTGAWTQAPAERDPRYFRCWQRVSLALQDALRQWIPELYFRDESRFEDRGEAFQVLAYAASQPSHGEARTEFTYDVADRATLERALRHTGRRMQAALAPVEGRLRASQPELSRRYAPVWFLDVLVAVRARHARLIALLAAESKVIDALIDLGTGRDEEAVKRFERIANAALRSVAGTDFRELIPGILKEATRVLEEHRRSQHSFDGRVFQGNRARAAGSPSGGIGGEKDGDHGCPDGGGKMTDA